MAAWRQMREADVDNVVRVADIVHPSLPESSNVFLERVQLFPAGCRVLSKNETVIGYIISHPIRYHEPPALNSLLGEIPPDANQYYIHDMAILPEGRGNGSATTCIKYILQVGKVYSTTCLISVYGTAPFWARFGFDAVPLDASLRDKVRNYGEDAQFLCRQNT